MRRAPLVLLTIAASALGGCASWNDRYGHLHTDPVLWFLGGAPNEMQLDWPRREVPTLRPLISTDLVAPRDPHPLDYPRGWSPDNPPYAPIDGTVQAPAPGADDASCPDACGTAPTGTRPAGGGDARGGPRSRGD